MGRRRSSAPSALLLVNSDQDSSGLSKFKMPSKPASASTLPAHPSIKISRPRPLKALPSLDFPPMSSVRISFQSEWDLTPDPIRKILHSRTNSDASSIFSYGVTSSPLSSCSSSQKDWTTRIEGLEPFQFPLP